MSSPSRPLSPKRDSLFNSRPALPTKPTSIQNTPVKLSHTPVLRKPLLGKTRSPQAKSPRRRELDSPGFQIYEDKPGDYEKYHAHSPLSPGVHDDKENILQPKILALPQTSYTHRRPLADLSPAAFPGYCLAASSFLRRPVRLTEVYQPASYDNESRSAHKFNGLPSFVTPPRNAMAKILHRLQMAGDDVDELELRLLAKLRDVARRKRAMSVGKNHGKLHLVRKNTFKIHA